MISSNEKYGSTTFNQLVLQPQWISPVAGMLAGGITALFTAPLDTAKTQQIAMLRQTSCFPTLKNILTHDGFLGLYRGFSATLLGLMPTWAIYWWVYTYCQHMQIKTHPYNENSTLLHLSSAMIAGVTTSVLINPIWLVRTRLQVSDLVCDAEKYKSIPQAISNIMKKEGLQGFMKGVLPSLFGVVHVCIQFPIYEHAKFQFAKLGNKKKSELSPGEIIISTAASKSIASIIAFPHEVLRVRQQIDRYRKASLPELVKQIFQQEGPTGFYRGLSTNLIRVIPASCITFLSFEYISRYLTNKTTQL